MRCVTEVDEIVKIIENMSLGDEIYLNERARPLRLTEIKYSCKTKPTERNAPYCYYVMEGNGTEYLLTVFKDHRPNLYTESQYQINDVYYADGVEISYTRNAEYSRVEFVKDKRYCEDCGSGGLFDSVEEHWYFPCC